jgi:hypothetical protein
MASSKVLSWHLPGGIEESHEKPQSEWSASWPKFELGT